MAGGKLILLGEADAKLLRQLLTALKDAIPQMQGMRIDFFDVVDPAGARRKLKLLASDKESGPSDSVNAPGPSGGHWQTITYCDDADVEQTADFWIR